MKILVVEDNLIIAENLIEQLNDLGYGVSHARESCEAERIFDEQALDLLILDIELDNSPLNGVQLAKKLMKKKRISHIYLSAKYKNQAYLEGAKKTKPAYFLTKPVTSSQLAIAIDFTFNTFNQQVIALSNSQPNLLQTPRTVFFIKKNNRIWERLNAKDIVWLQAAGMNTEINLVGGTLVIANKTLALFWQEAQGAFLRTHRSYAINPLFVSAFDKTTIYLKYGINKTQLIPVSDAYRRNVHTSLQKL